MSRTIHVFMLMAAVIVLAGCGVPAGASAPAGTPAVGGSAVVASGSTLLEASGAVPKVGDAAPDFEYTLPDGTTQRLSDLRGKKVLINFWATWCAPCRVEMPALQAASVNLKRDGLVVLGVNRIESPSDIAAFGQEFGVTFPLITNREGDVVNGYGAVNLPTSYFINADGTVAKVHLGVLDEAEIAEQVEAMP